MPSRKDQAETAAPAAPLVRIRVKRPVSVSGAMLLPGLWHMVKPAIYEQIKDDVETIIPSKAS